MTAASVTASDLGVRFLFNSQGDVVTPLRSKLALSTTETWGLRHITTEIRAGEGVALLGASGSGKTTLLRAIAGVMPADEGEVWAVGRVGSMLATDAGLLPDLTGRENAVLLAVLAGSARAEAKASLEAIKERSGLGDAFEHPASTYSQGMRARLGFSAAMTGDPDVIVLDEVHEALDHEFREKLGDAIADHLARGGIAMAAGHDHEILSRMLPRALLLERGSIIADGPFDEVRAAYLPGRAEAAGVPAG